MHISTLPIIILALLLSPVLAADGHWKRKFSIPRITSRPIGIPTTTNPTNWYASLTPATSVIPPSIMTPTPPPSVNPSSITKGISVPGQETSSLTTGMTTITTKMGNGTLTLTRPVSTAPVSTGGAAMGMGMLGAGPLVGAGVAALAFL